MDRGTPSPTGKFHVFTNAGIPEAPEGYLVVPQAAYRTTERNFVPSAPIQFGGGIHLDRALIGDYGEIPDPDTIVSIPTAKICLRIMWPGYSGWSKHVNIPHPNGTCKKGALASRLARQFQEFLDQMSGNIPAADTGAWNISNTSLQDLMLLEVRHVSKGSWQAILCKRFA